MNSVNKMDLIDLYYPTDETIAALLTVPQEQREAVLRRILGASEAGMDPHISRSLSNDRCIRRQRSVMEIGYLSAFVLSKLYRWFPWILTARRSRAAQIFHGQSLVRFTTNTHKIQFRHAPLHLTPSTAGSVVMCVTMSK